jgi:hypothetical protein
MTTTADPPRRYDPETDGPLLWTKHVAARYHVDAKTVARWARDGLHNPAGGQPLTLPHLMTPGGHRRYPQRWVAEWVEAALRIELPTARDRTAQARERAAADG